MSSDELAATGEAVLSRLTVEAARYGVPLPGLAWSSGLLSRERDPATGIDALCARWLCDGRAVRLTLRPDGHVYGECDLLVDHPSRPDLWMDVLALWGTPSALKCEPSVLVKPA